MGELHGNTELHAHIENLSCGIKDLLRVRTNVGGDHFAAAAAWTRSGEDLLAVGTGRISHPIRYAQTTARKSTRDPCAYQLTLRICRRGVAINRTGTPAKISVSRKHADIYRSSGLINNVEVVRRITAVVAAVAADGRGHAHTQHAVKYRTLRIRIDTVVPDRVFMHMYVDKTGTNDFTGCIDALVRLGHVLRDICHTSVFYQKVEIGIDPVGRIDEMSAVNKCLQSAAPPVRICDHYTRTFCKQNCGQC